MKVEVYTNRLSMIKHVSSSASHEQVYYVSFCVDYREYN
ncbi:hypothetical protein BvCmsL71A_04842 [Escherichia coli]|nr:hypothetical protein BvCmsL71A_04842 [Escherichia coli]